MTEILTRIGALPDDLSMPRNEHDVLSDAADEIARLRTIYASAVHGRGQFRDALRAQRKELAACRLREERLREALSAIGVLPDGYCFCFGSVRDASKPESDHTGECLAARAALSKTKVTDNGRI